jgi:predicted ATP-binding protein involved in virulence
MMANSVRYIKAVGVFDRFDLEQEFQPGVNILYGRNGTGKTTLLQILANILNCDFERFAFLPFETIDVHLDKNEKIKLRKDNNGEESEIEAYIDETLATSFSVSATQENRTILEASSEDDDPYLIRYIRNRAERQTLSSTLFARRFFGDFVPWMNFPSPTDVSQNLATEMQQALNIIANVDRLSLSNAFLDIYATLSVEESQPSQGQLEAVLEKINSLFSRLEQTSIISDISPAEDVFSRLRELVLSSNFNPGIETIYVLPMLEVYKRSLEKRAEVQEQAQGTIKTYLDSVNRFLEGKEIVLKKTSRSPLPVVQVKFHGTEHFSPIRVLSSGERQIVTLIYSATHMSTQQLVLIDEPEISLHIDWQSLLIPEMAAQLQDRQIITCTHSPMIGADYEDQMAELEYHPTILPPSEEAVEEMESNL